MKLSSIEKRTRKLVEEIRKKRQKNYMKANIERIKRYVITNGVGIYLFSYLSIEF